MAFGQASRDGKHPNAVKTRKKLLVKKFTFMQVCARFRKLNRFRREIFSLKAFDTERECAPLIQF